MSDAPRPPDTDGLTPPPAPVQRITAVEIVALILTAVWLVVVAGFAVLAGGGGRSLGDLVLTLVTVMIPIALIWLAAATARTTRDLRAEAARLRASLDAVRTAQADLARRDDLKPHLMRKIEEIARAQREAQGRATRFAAEAPRPRKPEPRGAAQPQLPIGTPVEDLADPITTEEFVAALDFPENEHDVQGFRILRRALEDRRSERLIRASQDVLTLLSQDGIYTDDLIPDRARPEVWRRFAAGERGRSIAALGGIRDRTSLALVAGRMKADPVFRDAVHHFLRQFDRTFLEFESHATDAEIVAMADTRTARAFMLVGRVAGTFD